MPGIYAEKPSSDFQPVEPGTYVARCFSMIEIGTIEVNYGDGEKKVHKVHISWELPTEKAVFNEEKGEQPYIVSREFNLSMHSKADLRKTLESWRGKAYTEEEANKIDITNVLGKECMLTIVHEPSKTDSSKVYSKVASVSKLMKGQICPPQINPSRLLCFESFNWEVYNSLTDNMKKKVNQSVEFKKLSKPTNFESAAKDDDDLAF
jgi:hypothetical protein